MDISDLDGTNTGSILFETRNSVHDARTLSLNFIPNLNPKAKYMLFAASIRVVSFFLQFAFYFWLEEILCELI